MKLFLIISFFYSSLFASPSISNFSQAKKFLNKNLDLYGNKTIYCSCSVRGSSEQDDESSKSRKHDFQKGVSSKRHRVENHAKISIDLKSCGYKIQKDAKRASRLEWEHVVPAEAFGQSFVEWREGSPNCKKKGKAFKGRKCAETNPEFDKMESDLYNLFPEIGELNGLRSNYSMASLTSSDRDFDGCKVKLADRKFEPQDASKGIVARTYLNFDNRYPGRGVVSEKNRPLFEAWNKMYPLTELECRRWKAFEKVNGYKHLFANNCVDRQE